METECAWCNKPIEDKPGIIHTHEKGVSHGICLKCMLQYFPVVYQLIYGDKTVEEVQSCSPTNTTRQ